MKSRRGMLQVLKTDTYICFKEGVNSWQTSKFFLSKFFCMQSLLWENDLKYLSPFIFGINKHKNFLDTVFLQQLTFSCGSKGILLSKNMSTKSDPERDCFGFGCRRQQKRHAAAPPPTGVRRRMKRKRQKPVGRDKGSLTEQQREGTGTTTIQIRRK